MTEQNCKSRSGTGATLLALLVAACLLYLGGAAISVPDNPGSWGLFFGAIAITAAAAYTAVTVRTQGSPTETTSGGPMHFQRRPDDTP